MQNYIDGFQGESKFKKHSETSNVYFKKKVLLFGIEKVALRKRDSNWCT